MVPLKSSDLPSSTVYNVEVHKSTDDGDDDLERRILLCYWFVQKCDGNPQIPLKVL